MSKRTTRPRPGPKPSAEVLARLARVIEGRHGADPKASYTARLLAQGPAAVARKLGEEAVETIIAGVGDDVHRLASESADLLYHLLVLWAAAGLRPEDVWAELARREGVSGLAEKASRRRPARPRSGGQRRGKP